MITDYFRLEGKKALITGAGKGIGARIATAFAEMGADVALIARTESDLESVASEVRDLGREALTFACDVTDESALAQVVEGLTNHWGSLDILVNNAGMSPLYPDLESVSGALFDKVVGVNLKGPFRLMARAGTHMAAGDGGSIINISSIASLQPSPHAEPYGAAKAGLNALTESFAWAFGPKVRVNAIAAGPFLTDISKAWDMEAFSARRPRRRTR